MTGTPAGAEEEAARTSGEETTPDDIGASAGSSRSMRPVALGAGRLGALAALAAQLLSIATTVVLARLLVPHDIGLVAGATVVIGLFEILVDVGLAASIVQRGSTERRVLSTNYWSAVLLGLAVAAAAGATSTVTAALIGDREVRPFIVAVALVSAVGFASAVPTAILQRDLRYRAMYGARVGALVVYAGTAVTVAALTDLGAWSIVVARAAQVVVEWSAVTLAARFLPAFQFDLAVVRRDLRFNAGYWGNTLASYGAKNADYWAVGRMLGPASLGLYYVAYVLPNIMRQRMTWVAQDVLFPLLARLDDRDGRLAGGYLRTARLVAFVAYPALIGVGAVAERVIEVFFGPKWSGAALPMEILAVSAAVDALTPLASVFLVARGEPGVSLVVNAVRLAVLVAGLVVAAAYGALSAVALAVLASSAVAAVYGQHRVARRLGTGAARVFAAVWPMAVAAAAMGLVVRALDQAVGGRIPSVPALALAIGTGALTYLAGGLLLGRRLFLLLLRDLLDMARPGRRVRALDGMAAGGG